MRGAELVLDVNAGVGERIVEGPVVSQDPVLHALALVLESPQQQVLAHLVAEGKVADPERVPGKGVNHLLRCPLGRRMFRDIEMNRRRVRSTRNMVLGCS